MFNDHMLEKLEGNKHFSRVLTYLAARSDKAQSVLDLSVNCGNHPEFTSVYAYCVNAADRELDADDTKRLQKLAASLYSASVVEKVAGFYFYEPTVEEMKNIQTLFFKPETELHYRDRQWSPAQTREITLDIKFSADTNVPLKPNVQLKLFGD